MSLDPVHLTNPVPEWFPSLDDPWVHRAPGGGDVATCGVVRHPSFRPAYHVDDDTAEFVCPTCDPEKPEP